MGKEMVGWFGLRIRTAFSGALKRSPSTSSTIVVSWLFCMAMSIGTLNDGRILSIDILVVRMGANSTIACQTSLVR